MSRKSKLLIVAFHYPPASGTSGVQRALRFSTYLPEYGWDCVVLSAHPRVYEETSTDLSSQILPETIVSRAQAWDTKKHLSLLGRYPTRLALPDRWCTWRFFAVYKGMQLIRQHKPSAIWSTYPIATAHWIGAVLAKKSGLPLLADFRDPMAQEGYPENKVVWDSFERIERLTVQSAKTCTFTTPSAVQMYQERYPERAEQMHLLENGYEEAAFRSKRNNNEALVQNQITLLHSGMVYPSERDPRSLFSAMKKLREESPDLFGKLNVRFRAPGHGSIVEDLAKQFGVDQSIEVLESIPYVDALEEMQSADGLLILQASNCNAQIPAKFYEYLRAGPPLLVVTDPAGDTATVAKYAGINRIGNINESEDIANMLMQFLFGNIEGMRANHQIILSSTRQKRTESLADMLNQII